MAVGHLVIASKDSGPSEHTHVQASSNPGTLERLLGAVFLPGGHQTWHLTLGQLDFSPAERGQIDVGDLELLRWFTHAGYLCGFNCLKWYVVG